MTETPISLTNLSLTTFSGNDPNYSALEFWNSVEQKINFSLGAHPGSSDPGKKKNYENRQRYLFGSLLTDTALEWYKGVDAAKTLTDIKKEFLDRFTDGRDNFKFRNEVENASRQEGELIKNYFHRIKHAVDRGWPEDIPTSLAGNTAGIDEEKKIQSRQREQKYIDFAIRGLQPPSLKRKAHERRIEQPHETWENLQNHLITKDLTYVVSTEGTNKQAADKISSLETQIKELTSLIKSNEVSAIQGPSRDPNVKGRPNGTRFCDYCSNHGHSISACNKKRLDDEVKKLRKEIFEHKEPKQTFGNNYKKNGYNNRPPYNNNSNNYGYQNRYNNNNNNNPRYGNKHNRNYNAPNHAPYDQKFPLKNTFNRNEMDAIRHYNRQEEERTKQNYANLNQNYRNGSTQDRRDYDWQNEDNVRFVQEEETNYCDAISDLFPLNY